MSANASQIADSGYAISGFDGLHLMLYHVTDTCALSGIEKDQAMKRGSAGKLGGAIYFADSVAVASEKAQRRGVTLAALVEVGRIIVLHGALNSSIKGGMLEKLRCGCIKCVYSNGAEYVIYNPRLVKVVWVIKGVSDAPRVVFPSAVSMPECKYGGNCEHTNPDHFAMYKHSVPPKFPMRIPTVEKKPDCNYGKDCRIKDPHHFAKYSHPSLTPLPPLLVTKTATAPPLPPCKYGFSCYRTNPDHFREYSHPPGVVPMCRYGNKCRDTTPDHRVRFRHY